MWVVVENWEESTDDFRAAVAGRYSTEEEARRAAWRMSEECSKWQHQEQMSDPTFIPGHNEFEVMTEAEYAALDD